MTQTIEFTVTPDEFCQLIDYDFFDSAEYNYQGLWMTEGVLKPYQVIYLYKSDGVRVRMAADLAVKHRDAFKSRVPSMYAASVAADVVPEYAVGDIIIVNGWGSMKKEFAKVLDVTVDAVFRKVKYQVQFAGGQTTFRNVWAEPSSDHLSEVFGKA